MGRIHPVACCTSGKRYNSMVSMMDNAQSFFDVLRRPELYEATSYPFWADDYISQSMLQAHLRADSDGASRTHEFIVKSAKWLGGLAVPVNGKRLLDLGCGPGLYTELFQKQGFTVFGVDISQRSIDYAREHTSKAIQYSCGNYLEVTFPEEIDLMTIIYCDFGVLNPENRVVLLKKIFAALKPGGMFVLDVFSRRQYATFCETSSISEYQKGGFWSSEPHILLERRLAYSQDNTYLHQVTVVTGKDKELKHYHIWEHVFTCKELVANLRDVGFGEVEFYGDISGKPMTRNSKTICAVAYKNPPLGRENN